MLSGLNIALPSIAADLSLSAIELSWISLAFSLSAAVFVMPFGKVADIWGRKKVLIIGLIISTLTTFALIFAFSPLFFILLRVAQGIGNAMMFSTSVAVLTSAYTPQERGRGLGINVAAVYLGRSLGPTIGGIITQHLGWQYIFVLFVIIQVPILCMLFFKIKSEWAEASGDKYDYTGSILFSVMLFAVLYGFSLVPSARGYWIIAEGAAVLILFILWEKREKSPILDVRLFARSLYLSASTATHAVYYCAIFSIPLALSLYLQYIGGLSPQNAGFVLLVQPLIQVIFSPFAGRLSSRIQPRAIVSAGIGIVLIGLVMLTLSYGSSGIGMTIGSLALMGFGHAFFASPNTNSIISFMDRKYYGVASAMESTSRNIGIAFGTGIVMLLFALYMGSAQITPEHYPAFIESVGVMYKVFTGLCFLALITSAFRGKLKVKAQ
jgi:MFS family permease